MIFYSRFSFYFWGDCWFFIGDDIGFEVGYNMRIWEGSIVGIGIIIPIFVWNY